MSSTLKATLDSLRSFPEVILLDNGSTDETLLIAGQYPNVKIHHSPFLGFGPLRNRAASLATHDWILAIDSDEVLSSPLMEEIQQLALHPSKSYALSRHNYYRGKRIFGCGWGGEWVARLYHRHHNRFSDAPVHESLVAEKTERLRSPLLHTPYRTTEEFLAKMQHYSTLFAEQHRHRKRSSFTKALCHAFYAFFRSYFLKRGLFCGQEGFLIAIYNANTTFYKYLKLAEMNETGSQ